MTLVAPALESPRSPRIAGTYANRVIDWARRRLHMRLGPWQCYALERMLEHDADGNLLARLILLSVARQNGKSVIVRSLVGWLMDEGYALPAFSTWQYVVLAAHDANQARVVYDGIRKDVISYNTDIGWRGARAKEGREVARATHFQGIEINGVLVTVATRQAGSGRGVSPGLVAFDEVLTQTSFDIYEVLTPALSAVPNSQMLMTSTAGFADSVVLRAQHDRLYRQATGAEQYNDSFMGLWWRADSDEVGLDWDELRKANPALDDGRLQRVMIQNEYEVMPHGSWVRERLNRWHDERVDAPFSIAAWGACREREPLDPAQVADGYVVACDVTSTWFEGSVIVAAQRKDGRVGVEVHRHLAARPELPLTADDFTREVAKIAERVKVTAIVYTVSSPLAPAFERHAVEGGLPYQSVPGTKVAMACADFAEAVMSRRLAHDDPWLDTQVASAQRRPAGPDGTWRWAISVVPITGVIGATLASSYAAKSVAPIQVFL